MHIASSAGYPDIAMIFMKRGVPIHTSNKVRCLSNCCIPTGSSYTFHEFTDKAFVKGSL